MIMRHRISTAAFRYKAVAAVLCVVLVGTPLFGSSLLCAPTSDTADCASMNMHAQSQTVVTNQTADCCKVSRDLPGRPPANIKAENRVVPAPLVCESARIDTPEVAPIYTTNLQALTASPPDLQSLLCVLLI
jgi:hypothetical protein